MNPGPEKGAGRPGEASFADKLKARLPNGAPDWQTALAELADQHGLKRAGEIIGYSGGAISQVLSGKYPGKVDRVEQAVQGALMGLEVECPALRQLIGRNVCLTNQRRPLSAANQDMVKVYFMCRSGACRHSKSFQGGDDAE